MLNKPQTHKIHMPLQTKLRITVKDSYSFSRTNHTLGKTHTSYITPEAKSKGRWLVKRRYRIAYVR